MLSRRKLHRLLYLGDVYERGSAEEFSRNYAPVWGRFATRTAPTIGNHEYALRDEGYRPYWNGVYGQRMPDYYAFRASGWQLLSLNSELDHHPGSRQTEWLERRLKRSSRFGTCRLAFLHRPRWSAGPHGDDEDIEPLYTPLIGKARIVVAAHDHNMQRLARRDGITSFVSGAGGRSLYSLDEDDPRLNFANDSVYGALRLRLRRERAAFAFIDSDGDVLDRGRVRCRRGKQS